MKINLNTMEAEGTPQEIHELMELKKRIIKPEEPGQDIGPVRIEKMAWKSSRETRKRAAVNNHYAKKEAEE